MLDLRLSVNISYCSSEKQKAESAATDPAMICSDSTSDETNVAPDDENVNEDAEGEA